MAFQTVDQAKITQMALARGVLETELARRMYGVFNGQPLIGKLRELVGLAIEQIVALGMVGAKSNEQYSAALLDAGKNLAVWRGRDHNVIGLRNVLKDKNTWAAADCSDLIRLFGGVIEFKPLQQSGNVGKDVEQFRMDQRPGGDTHWGKTRARDREGFKPTPEAPHTAEGRAAMLKFRRQPGEFAGIKGTGLLNLSTVKRIDFVFGLPEGCDISGTTADSIFFMRHVNAFIKGLPETISRDMIPLVQLLPVATMVSQAHHTLLECALTLTLNGILSYHVGFYTTLMPPDAGYPPLQGVFETFERDIRNKHFLCYRDSQRNRLEGCLYIDPSDLRKFREAAHVGFPFMSDFLGLPIGLSREQLFGVPRFRALPH